ncbi:MAG: hypothetical protein ACRC1K_15525 [Planctomycetia bacterium]
MTPIPTLPFDRTRPDADRRTVADVLRVFRRRLRFSSLMEGVALFASLAAAVFWTTLAVDYALEPTTLQRVPLTVAAGLALLAGAGFWVAYRLRPRVTDAQLAVAIENRVPALADRLSTAVELSTGCHNFSPSLVEQSTAEAERLLAEVDVRRLVAARPVRDAAGLAALAVGGVVAFASLHPAVAEQWWRRVVGQSPERYPHVVHLRLDGFRDGVRKVGRGSDVELLVDAEPAASAPAVVDLRYRFRQSRVAASSDMARVGPARFRHVFRNVQEPIRLSVRGGDDYIPELSIEPVDPPALTLVELAVEYPAYTGETPRVLSAVGGPLPLPIGAVATVRLRANKPLESMRWRAANGNSAVLDDLARVDESTFTGVVRVQTDLTLVVDFTDADGVGPREPFPLAVVAVPDEPPTVEAVLDGVSNGVTPEATLPFKIEAVDDYGLAALRFVFTVRPPPAESKGTDRPRESTSEPAPERTSPIDLPGDDPRKRAVGALLDLRPSSLAVGAKLEVGVEAADAGVLDGRRVGRSVKFPFEVLSVDELLSRLATRELQLRLRFEQILRELRSARGALADVRSSSSDVERRLLAERCLQGVRKSAAEVASLRLAFQAVLAELVNNRINETTLLERLETRIVGPLQAILADDFPRVDDAVAALPQPATADEAVAAQSRAETAFDALLAKCDALLEAMRKLESFQELVATLRSLIERQEALIEETKSRRKKDVLDLLQ